MNKYPSNRLRRTGALIAIAGALAPAATVEAKKLPTPATPVRIANMIKAVEMQHPKPGPGNTLSITRNLPGETATELIGFSKSRNGAPPHANFLGITVENKPADPLLGDFLDTEVEYDFSQNPNGTWSAVSISKLPNTTATTTTEVSGKGFDIYRQEVLDGGNKVSTTKLGHDPAVSATAEMRAIETAAQGALVKIAAGQAVKPVEYL